MFVTYNQCVIEMYIWLYGHMLTEFSDISKWIRDTARIIRDFSAEITCMFCVYVDSSGLPMSVSEVVVLCVLYVSAAWSCAGLNVSVCRTFSSYFAGNNMV